MRQFQCPQHSSRTIGRLVACLLLVAALSIAAGGMGRSHPATADGGPQPPQLLTVRLEKPDTAYVTFRETNDVGADVAGGLQYFIYWAEQGDGVELRTRALPRQATAASIL